MFTRIKTWFVGHEAIFRSWALYVALASLAGYVIYQATGVDMSGAFTVYMGLLLPVLVAFGIINDPAVRSKLGLASGMRWYQSTTVWMALISLAAYTCKIVFGFDLGTYLNGLFDAALPIMMLFGIVKSTSLTPV